MKILQVVPFFTPAHAFGGPVEVAFQVSRELVKRGHEVAVYTSDVKDRDSRLDIEPVKVVDGIKVHYMRNLSMMTFKKSNLFLTPELISQSKKEIKEFDVIHLRGYRNFQNIVIYHYARKYNIPYVLTSGGSLPKFEGKKRLKLIYDALIGYNILRNATKVVARNRLEYNQFKNIGIPENKIVILPVGIDIYRFKDLPSKGLFRNKFKISDNMKIILYLGRLHHIKGIDILVKAFARVLNILKNVKLVIVGPDDGYLCEIEALIKALSIEENVLITGPLYDMDKLEAYIDADLYVLPSRSEAFGLTVLEAYSCYKPVIASRVGGLNDIVIDGVTGLLFDPENIEQLVESILSLLEDNTKSEKMGVKGKQFVKENFAIEKVVDQLEVLYKEIATLVHA